MLCTDTINTLPMSAPIPPIRNEFFKQLSVAIIKISSSVIILRLFAIHRTSNNKISTINQQGEGGQRNDFSDNEKKLV